MEAGKPVLDNESDSFMGVRELELVPLEVADGRDSEELGRLEELETCSEFEFLSLPARFGLELRNLSKGFAVLAAGV